MTHKRHTDVATEVLVQIDVTARQVQTCERLLDQHAEAVGDVDWLRQDLRASADLLCSIGDYVDGAREISDPHGYVMPRYGVTIAVILLGFTYGEALRDLFNNWWVGLAVTFVVALVMVVAIWWGLGWLMRHLDYRRALRLAQLPEDPRQQGSPALDSLTREWVRRAPFEENASERARVLTGIAWVITGSARREDSHLPTEHANLRVRLDVIRAGLGDAATTANPKAYDLYVRANTDLDRLAALLVRMVEDIERQVDNAAIKQTLDQEAFTIVPEEYAAAAAGVVAAHSAEGEPRRTIDAE